MSSLLKLQQHFFFFAEREKRYPQVHMELQRSLN